MKRVVLTTALCFGTALKVFGQDAIARGQRSMLQPEQEVEALPAKFDELEYLTGDWGGARERLLNAGVEVFAFYNSIISGNVSGGKHPRNATIVDDAWIGLKFDLEKLIEWKGAQFVVGGVNRDGDDLTHKYIGSIYSVQQMVGGQRSFLYQLYLRQKLLNDKLVLKIGRYGASDDFNASSFYGYSLNNGINGDIRNVLFNTRFSAYPFPTYMGVLFYDPTPEFNAKVGIFQVSEGMFENDDNGLNFGIGDRDGFTVIGQFGWTPEFGKQIVSIASSNGKHSSAHAEKGMPGHYWIGFTYSNWELYQKFGGGFQDDSYGFYAHADQMIYQEPGSDEGLTVFVASGYYPQSEISIVPFQINVGLNYKGLFPSRNEDRTILYFIYGDISDDYARSVRVPGGGLARSEEVIEFAHRFQLTPWSYFQPDIQYVVTPSGTGDIADAVVIGAQMGVTF